METAVLYSEKYSNTTSSGRVQTASTCKKAFLKHLAASGEGSIIFVVSSLGAKTTVGERLPEKALVGTGVSVSVGLDNGVTGS